MCAVVSLIGYIAQSRGVSLEVSDEVTCWRG